MGPIPHGPNPLGSKPLGQNPPNLQFYNSYLNLSPDYDALVLLVSLHAVISVVTDSEYVRW